MLANETYNREDLLDIRDSLRQVVIDGTRWLTTGLSAIFIVYIAFNSPNLDDPDVQAVTIYDAVLLAIFVTFMIAYRRKRIPIFLANPVICALSALVISNVLFTVLTYEDPTDLGYCSVILIGPGAFALSYRWHLVSIAMIIGASLPVAWISMDQPDLTNFGFALFAGGAISTSIHAHRLRTQRRLSAMRLKDKRQAATLTQAIEAVENELSERKRAETKRKQLEEQLRQSQKMEAVGLLAGGIAHDMNNVLGAITALASTMKDENLPSGSWSEEIDQILASAKRGSEFTRNLLGYARKGKYEKREISVEHTVHDVERLLERTIPKEISLEVRATDHLDHIQGDPSQITHVLMNLCLNSVDAMQGNGKLTITAENVALDAEDCILIPGLEPGRHVKISVEDTGMGIESENLDRVFDPFYTTKPSGEGTGLGLSMVYGTIQNHGGSVSIASEPGHGTFVTLILPSLIRTISSEIPASPRGVERGSGVILLVDDEAMIRSATTRMLKSMGYKVIGAVDGRQALELYKENRDRIMLVILDMGMPVMGGTECFTKLRELDPAVRVLISSGFSESTETETMLAQGAVGFLGKPYEKSDMAKAITEALIDQ